MKKIMTTMVGAVLMTATIFTGCESSNSDVENARDNLHEAKVNVVEANIELNQSLRDSIQLFKTELEQKISSYDIAIAELKTKAANQKKDKISAYTKTLNELESKSNQLKTKLKEYKEEGLDQWTSFKKEFNHDASELGEAIKDITKNNVK